MRADLERIFRAGVEACLPEHVLPSHLPAATRGATVALAIGKAAAAMARVAESRIAGPLTGLAVMPHGARVDLDRIEILHAGHPIPDAHSVAAAGRLLELARRAGADDRVLVLLSGGASALACLPASGLTLAEKKAITSALLRSGAAIAEINCVRRHLSRFKGGRLALAAAPALLLTLAISDVPGDRPEDIGSGPTAADPTSMADAQAILGRHGLAAPGAGWTETPEWVAGEYRIVARPADALAAAATQAYRLGYRPVQFGQITGIAREIGRLHAERARAADAGTALISGGELEVRVSGSGSGGRNHEYALAAAIALTGRADMAGLAADSDGRDGSSGAAGAFFDGTTVARSERDPLRALEASDSGGFFADLGDQFVTGDTDTNISDLRIILVAP